MKKYISIIPLGESATDFAIQLGIVAIQNDKYVCKALDESGELLHEQTFALKKSVEGIPSTQALQADALEAWKKRDASPNAGFHPESRLRSA